MEKSILAGIEVRHYGARGDIAYQHLPFGSETAPRAPSLVIVNSAHSSSPVINVSVLGRERIRFTVSVLIRRVVAARL